MRASLAGGQQWGCLGLDRVHLDVRIMLLQSFAGAGYGATGTDASHENIHVAVSVGPNLLAGSLAVNLRVGGIGELAGQDGVTALGDDLVCLVHSTLHASGTRGEHDLCTVGAQQHAAFQRHGFRHGQHHAIAAGGTHQGQGDTSVAGGGLHDGATRFELAGGLGGIHNCLTNAVLHRVCRVEKLQLDQHIAG